MLNKKSSYLTVLIATHNRLELLKKTLDSIAAGTACPHEVFVIDAGSTDGTIELIRSRADVTPVLQGERLGTSRAYNRVWREIDSRFTVWLSDDTEVAAGALDRACKILEADESIGMVGLKMRDTLGPYAGDAYMGGISEYGILNCNHGVLPMSVLRSVGYFNESYRSYTIDPDLTASVLSAGKSVVFTRETAIRHHREWSAPGSAPLDRAAFAAEQKKAMGGIDNAAVYRAKFQYLQKSSSGAALWRRRVVDAAAALLFAGARPGAERFGLNRRDWYNVARARWVRPGEPFQKRGGHYLIQRIPRKLLLSDANPYRAIASGTARPAFRANEVPSCAN